MTELLFITRFIQTCHWLYELASPRLAKMLTLLFTSYIYYKYGIYYWIRRAEKHGEIFQDLYLANIVYCSSRRIKTLLYDVKLRTPWDLITKEKWGFAQKFISLFECWRILSVRAELKSECRSKQVKYNDWCGVDSFSITATAASQTFMLMSFSLKITHTFSHGTMFSIRTSLFNIGGLGI